MTKLTRIATTPLIAVAMFASTSMVSLAQTAQDQNNPSMSSATNGGPEQDQAYRDGVQAATLDKVAKRKIDAKSSHLYVHPPVKKEARDAYRNSFQKGYEKAVQQQQGQGE